MCRVWGARLGELEPTLERRDRLVEHLDKLADRADKLSRALLGQLSSPGSATLAFLMDSSADATLSTNTKAELGCAAEEQLLGA